MGHRRGEGKKDELEDQDGRVHSTACKLDPGGSCCYSPGSSAWPCMMTERVERGRVGGRSKSEGVYEPEGGPRVKACTCAQSCSMLLCSRN